MKNSGFVPDKFYIQMFLRKTIGFFSKVYGGNKFRQKLIFLGKMKFFCLLEFPWLNHSDMIGRYKPAFGHIFYIYIKIKRQN